MIQGPHFSSQSEGEAMRLMSGERWAESPGRSLEEEI